MKTLWRGLRMLGLATLVLALVGLAFFFMVKAILKPAPEAWATTVRAGPVTVQVGVPTLIWLANTPWVAPLLEGRRLPTRLGTAARLSKVSAKMLRHYESLGLLAPVARTDSGYRQYAEADVRTLQFIKRGRNRQRASASASVKRIAQKHVNELSHRIEAMQAMQRTLSSLLAHFQGDERADCPILDDLAGSCC